MIRKFSDFEKYQIMFSQVKACLNLVPFDLQNYLIRLGDVDVNKFNYFSPLEMLNGQCLADFDIHKSAIIQTKLLEQENE